MQVVLLRVAIDTGYGGMLGPVLPDGSFEYIPLILIMASLGRGVAVRASSCR